MSKTSAFRMIDAPAAGRRQLLATAPNPARHIDYVVTLENQIETRGLGAVSIELAYVPDRVTLLPTVFAPYLAALAGDSWESIEAMGASILADMESELVPRYSRIVIRGSLADGAYHVMIEGRQPDWKNDGLLARLR